MGDFDEGTLNCCSIKYFLYKNKYLYLELILYLRKQSPKTINELSVRRGGGGYLPGK